MSGQEARGSSPLAFLEASDFPALGDAARQWPLLAEEARTALERLAFLRFRFPTLYASPRPGVEGQRAMFYFRILGASVRRNLQLYPHTAALLESLPGVATAAFYVLGPKTRILPHCGVAQSLMLRAHLGLICPPECTLRIGEQHRNWVEGEWMVFDDTLEHEAWNDSDQTRCVLSLDFMPNPPEDAPEQLRRLRLAMLEGRQSELPWYQAGGLEIDAELLADLEQARARTGERRLELIESLVQSNGLFFT